MAWQHHPANCSPLVAISSEDTACVLGAAGIGIWVWNVQDDSMLCDDCARSLLLLGRGSPDNSLDAFLMRLDSGDFGRVADTVRRSALGKTRFHIECIVRSAQCHRRIELRGGPILGEPPGLLRIGGICSEVLETNRIELAKLELYRDLFDNAPDMMAVIRQDNGEIVECNKTFAQALGRERQELLGRPFLDFYDQASQEDAVRTFTHFSQTGKIDNPERIFRRADGMKIDVLLQATPIRNENGEIIASRSTWRDISRRRQAERALALHVEELARSNAELERFAYVCSHDLREPLRKIRIFCDRLASQFREPLGERGADYISRMASAVERMDVLIEDVMSYSRTGRNPLSLQKVALREVVDTVLDDLEARVEQAGARVEVGPLPSIDADLVQMRQLMQNLIGNALKFHRGEGDHIVRVYVAEGTKDACSICVEDNGIGFEPDQAERIFEPFQRLHTAGQYEGSGIGLAVCRRIAERLGGRITAAGRPGQGATFTVSLPLTQSVADWTIPPGP